jgi:hypothetical protein
MGPRDPSCSDNRCPAKSGSGQSSGRFNVPTASALQVPPCVRVNTTTGVNRIAYLNTAHMYSKIVSTSVPSAHELRSTWSGTQFAYKETCGPLDTILHTHTILHLLQPKQGGGRIAKPDFLYLFAIYLSPALCPNLLCFLASWQLPLSGPTLPSRKVTS